MSPNRKLTDTVKGRLVTEFKNEGNALELRFDDGSLMRIKGTQEGTNAVPSGAKVEQALERGERFEVRFEDGGNVVVKLEEAGSSVSVRDEVGKVLYLG